MIQKAFTLKELAVLTSSKIIGDENYKIEGVSDLESANEKSASFLANRRYLNAMQRSKAGVVFVNPETPLEEGRNFLISDNPSRAFQTVVEIFYADRKVKTGFKGIHPSAVIHPTAQIGSNVNVGPLAVIDEGVIIDEGSSIGASSYIGPYVKIGSDCFINPNVTIREYCTLGSRVIIQPGSVIGSCGFGYTTDDRGIHTKLEQVGSVVLEDDVEIGANTTIDRARFTETRIGKGSKIDNLVQIAHGVQIGRHNLIISQVGIAGSSKTGNHVVMAGQAALTGHVSIADGVIIAARGAADKSVLEPGGKYAGAPMLPLAENNRLTVHFRNIGKYVKRIEALEQSLKKLST